jgi:glycosyltransferase involved in cell wall biosynthesis
MSKTYTISAVILSKNSKDRIADCIKSVIGWADEVIVVDGESTDGSIEIAAKLGANVFSHKFLGAFSSERNFGTDQAKSDWVLQLDSDEIVTNELKELCDKTLPSTKCAAFKFLRKNTFLGHAFTYGGWYHYSQHLFKRGQARYEGRVHEKMIVTGTIGELPADVLHFPFDSITQFIDRQNRYTDLQAQDIIDTEVDIDIKTVKYNLTWKPLKLFKKMYLNKKGYKEGIYGLIFAILFSWVHFLKWLKVWEKLYSKKEK